MTESPTATRTASRRYAIVTLVMRGDDYVPGALVVAQSLRQVGSRAADLVCMVDASVSERARTALGRLFDAVREVRRLTFPVLPLPTDRQQECYGAWIHDSFTKWNALGLTEYEKVLLVDADLLFVENPDPLFAEVVPPAGVFWTLTVGPIRNHYPADLRQGDPVPRRSIERALRHKGMVVWASIVLLRPDPTALPDFITYMRRETATGQPFGYPSCYSGYDEQSVTAFYALERNETWRFLDRRFNVVPWWRAKMESLNGAAPLRPAVFHYLHTKPWQMPRHKWADLEAWWTTAERLVEQDETVRGGGTEGRALLASFFTKGDLMGAGAGAVREGRCSWCALSADPEVSAAASGHELLRRTDGRPVCPHIGSGNADSTATTTRSRSRSRDRGRRGRQGRSRNRSRSRSRSRGRRRGRSRSRSRGRNESRRR